MYSKILILFISILFNFSNQSNSTKSNSDMENENKELKIDCYFVDLAYISSDGVPSHYVWDFENVDDANAAAEFLINNGYTNVSIFAGNCGGTLV